jgi:thiamine biosynthesis lipoprotein
VKAFRLPLLLALGLAAATPRAAVPVRVELADEAMGTTFSVILYGSERASLERAGRAALDEAHRVDALISNYQPTSEWSRVNRDAAAGPVQVSQESFDLIAACSAYSQQSGGAFDITVGPLMRAWGFFKDEGALPAPSAIASAAMRVGYERVQLDAAQRTVRFTTPGMEIDPGGIGKGYAVDRMAAILKRQGVDAALVSGGGSSVYGLGAPPDEPRGWAVPIRAPADPHTAASTVFLRDLSVSTSGSYEKFFRAGGKIYSHIMDPRTGYPAETIGSVSIVAPRTIDSEAWAKPYFINGRAWTAAHVPATFRVFFCDDQEGRSSCSWIPQ